MAHNVRRAPELLPDRRCEIRASKTLQRRLRSVLARGACTLSKRGTTGAPDPQPNSTSPATHNAHVPPQTLQPQTHSYLIQKPSAYRCTRVQYLMYGTIQYKRRHADGTPREEKSRHVVVRRTCSEGLNTRGDYREGTREADCKRTLSRADVPCVTPLC